MSRITKNLVRDWSRTTPKYASTQRVREAGIDSTSIAERVGTKITVVRHIISGTKTSSRKHPVWRELEYLRGTEFADDVFALAKRRAVWRTDDA
jgi:hypothetical protein